MIMHSTCELVIDAVLAVVIVDNTVEPYQGSCTSGFMSSSNQSNPRIIAHSADVCRISSSC